MADKTITDLPPASASANDVVAADNAAGTLTSKVTLGSIAALGGGAPAAHASSHGSAGSDPITPASIGAVASNDSRLTNSRTPTSHAASHATGSTDPISPASIGAASATHQHVLADVSDAGTAASKNAPSVGNASATEVVLGSDTRLTNTRTPSSHAASHRATGADYPAPVCAAVALASDQNDWAPGVADVLYVTAVAARSITGLSAAGIPDGFCVTVINANASGGAAITLAHESSSSVAGNRFRSAYGVNTILYADGGSATLVYHSAISRWRVL